MITRSEKEQFLKILQSPSWKVIENLANEMIAKIKDESMIKDDEWGTLKSVVMNEGRIRGISNFIQEIYSQASQHDERRDNNSISQDSTWSGHSRVIS